MKTTTHAYAVYNGAAKPMDYIERNEGETPAKHRKRQFRYACMRVVDNANEGHVIDHDGTVYSVSRAYRRAKPVVGEAATEILDLVKGGEV